MWIFESHNGLRRTFTDQSEMFDWIDSEYGSVNYCKQPFTERVIVTNIHMKDVGQYCEESPQVLVNPDDLWVVKRTVGIHQSTIVHSHIGKQEVYIFRSKISAEFFAASCVDEAKDHGIDHLVKYSVYPAKFFR